MTIAGEQTESLLGRASLPAIAIACLLLAGCEGREEPSEPCPGRQPPAFVITVSAESGPLPSDLLIRLAYGGGEEEFRLGEHALQASVMFCKAHDTTGSNGAGGDGSAGTSGAAGAAGAPSLPPSNVSDVTCELWVEGAATVWVSGGDYVPIEVELSGEANACGPITVEEDLVLGASEHDEQ